MTAVQFAAGRRWSGLVADYAQACCSPRAPQSAKLDAGGGTAIDPDSAGGRREAKRHEAAIARYLEGRYALRLAGQPAETAVANICERDRAPAGVLELNALRTGLQALSAQWHSKRKAC